MSLQYSVDFNQNGTYTDITQYVKECGWTVGIMQPFSRFGHLNNLRMTLTNVNGEWNGEDATNRLSPYLNTPFPIKVTNSGTVLFWGRVRSIENGYIPSPNSGKTFVNLYAEGDRAYADNTEVEMNYLQDVTSDEVVKNLILQIPDKPLQGRFVIGVSELDGSDTIADIEDHLSSETGNSFFAKYPVPEPISEKQNVGDTPERYGTFRATNSISSYLEDVALCEGGWLFEGREKWHFWKSTHDFGSAIGTVTQNGDYKPISLAYEHSPDRFNVVVGYTSDNTDETEITMWSLETTITIPPQSEIKANVPLKINDKPVSGTNLKIKNVEGVGVSSFGIIPRGNKAEVTFKTNLDAGGTVTNADVIGYYSRSSNEMLITKENIDFANNDRATKPLRLNLRSLTDYERVDMLVEKELVIRSQLRYTISELTFLNSFSSLPDWTVGDVIKVDISNLSHIDEYVILGESHTAKENGLVHQIKYVLQPLRQMDLVAIWDKDDNDWDADYVWG